jgi:DnaJ-class molecular chaperone
VPSWWFDAESPLSQLTEAQLALVLDAEDLYELLEVESAADLETIHGAFRAQCKKWHPDMQQTMTRDATETMIRLNKAWEVLRSPELRRAYDWVSQQKVREAAG